jgi:hypothetical protein
VQSGRIPPIPTPRQRGLVARAIVGCGGQEGRAIFCQYCGTPKGKIVILLSTIWKKLALASFRDFGISVQICPIGSKSDSRFWISIKSSGLQTGS